MKTIGVVGMGVMGLPMSLNLLQAGFEVTVFNRTSSRCKRAADAGASVASSITDLTRTCEAIVLMMSDDQASQNIVLGKEGIRQAARRGLIVIDSATIYPQLTREIAEALDESGVIYLDAPVTGSRPQAEAGELFFLVGGCHEAYTKSIALFEAMGKKHIHLGKSGMGSCAKLGNNMMGLVNLVGLAEAMSATQRFGLDPDLFLQVVNHSGGRSAVSEGAGPRILKRDWRTNFALGMAAKDARLAKRLCDDMGSSSPMIEALPGIYEEACKTIGHDDDMCSLYQWYEQRDKI